MAVFFQADLSKLRDFKLLIEVANIEKYIRLVQKQFNVVLNEKQIFRGNILPPDAD